MKLTKVVLGKTDEFAVSILSDLHLDSPRCNFEHLKSKLSSFSEKFPIHRAIIIGDVGDFIVPGDVKRFSPSLSRPEIATRDDFIIARAEYIAEKLKELPVAIDVIGRGNHEDEVIKRFGIDPLSIICSKLGCSVGWYEGVVIYKVEISGQMRSLVFVYHHGAWGGRLAKGYNGAVDYFSQIEGWDVAVYGHNHASRSDCERKVIIDSRTSSITERDVYIINCSSWVNGREPRDNAVVPYDVRRGCKRLPNILNTVVARTNANEGVRKFLIKVITS